MQSDYSSSERVNTSFYQIYAKESLYLLNNREISGVVSARIECVKNEKENGASKRARNRAEGGSGGGVVERGRARRSNKMETAGWANNE